ncbi:uncharacterized protein LOC129587775 isoform X2 [Paramacrobiotus metropolitanus]|uniref:uncharacterized protein LOC129587775 isoform X2 n=1 Tax=Paramacrobiotus metropolitanus TaxID=2943436 RepID=UPI0024464251|nr:uncharacterized protein LOC129587775 isoform X2 [Paramacrobiotus metropolitanus]
MESLFEKPAVSEEMFEATKRMTKYSKEIQRHLNVKWSDMTKDQLDLPLISGLAVRLALSLGEAAGEKIPDSYGEQAQYWKKYCNRFADSQALETAMRSCRVKHCPARMDLCIMMDASGSIEESNFQRSRQFVKDMLDEVANDMVHTALVIFSSYVQPVLSFDSRISDIAEAVMNPLRTPYLQGSTHTSLAVDYCIGQFETFVQSAVGTPKINFLLTDGQSNGPYDNSLAESAATALAANITSFAIGVGNDINMTELLLVTGNREDRILTVNSPLGLARDKILQLAQTTCMIPLNPPFGKRTTDTVEKDQSRIIGLHLPEPGLEIAIDASEGSVVVYYAYDFEVPSAAVHDGKLPGNGGFVPPKPSHVQRRVRDTSAATFIQSAIDKPGVYISITGIEERNTYSFVAEPRRVPPLPWCLERMNDHKPRIWLCVEPYNDPTSAGAVFLLSRRSLDSVFMLMLTLLIVHL